jgi:hypothetical protein
MDLSLREMIRAFLEIPKDIEYMLVAKERAPLAVLSL